MCDEMLNFKFKNKIPIYIYQYKYNILYSCLCYNYDKRGEKREEEGGWTLFYFIPFLSLLLLLLYRYITQKKYIEQ